MRLLNSWNGYKSYILQLIHWVTIFKLAYGLDKNLITCMKINEKLLNRRLITCIIKLQDMLLKTNLEWLSSFKLNDDREKSFYGVQVFWHPYCSKQFQNSTGFKTEHESSIPALETCTHIWFCTKSFSKTFFIIFTIYIFMYIKYIEKAANLFYYYFLFFTMKQRNSMKMLRQKQLLLENFVDKATFNFQSFNKITQSATTTFHLFYLNPLSWPYDNRMDKTQFNW